MADDVLLPVNDPSDPRSLAVLPAGGPERHDGEWTAANALAQPAGAGGMLGPDLAVYLHAFRRHWLLSLGIGLVSATAVGLAAWFGVGEKYTASSYLVLDIQEKSVLSGPTVTMDRDRFEIFKSTQQGKLLSRFVLLAALRKPEVSKTRAVSEEQRRGGDPVDWLQRRLSVGFPGKGELMQVSISRPDPHEAAVLVNAVVESYLSDVVDAEREQKQQRLSKLESVCAAKDLEIRNTRNELRSLAAINGTSAESESITQKQKMILDDYALFRQELARKQFDVADLETQLAAQQDLLKKVDSGDMPTEEVDLLLINDPVTRELAMQLAVKKQEEMLSGQAASSNSQNRYRERYMRDLKMLQDEYDKKVDDAKKKVRERRHLAVEMDLIKFRTSFNIKRQQCDVLMKQVDKLKEEAAKFGSSTVDIEMAKSNVKQLELVYQNLDNEREKVKVELNSAPRIVLSERAEDPLLPSNLLLRAALSVLAMLAAFCCPAVVVVLWDARTRRINTADDVSQGLRLPVIGSVPLIPARVIRQLGSPSRRYQSWHVRLTESVDGITARILHKAELGQCRVIMVSSATGGEGKTTLATQLAMSLARTKRRIVLVDFDLRRPAFDGLFGVPLEPGVCDVLRHQNTVSELVRPSGTENLDVVTAGRWDRHTLASLSNGCAGTMFQQLRDAYEFVVIDTSPLLPVADARFVSQHVDAVVLSVLRDISQAPKIQAACDILAAFGVQSVEAVVTGPSYNLYGQHESYESTIPA